MRAWLTFGIAFAGKRPFLSSLRTEFGRGEETTFTITLRAASAAPVRLDPRAMTEITSAAMPALRLTAASAERSRVMRGAPQWAG